MPTTQTLLAQAYSSYNRRDIDSALLLMSDDVSWPTGPRKADAS